MLPLIAVGAGVVGTGAYLFFSGKPKTAKANPVASSPLHTATPPTTLPPSGPITIKGDYGPVTLIPLPTTPGATMVPGGATVFQTGTTPAGAPMKGYVSTGMGSPTSIAAGNLHDYLAAHSLDGSATLTGLIKAFQSAAIAAPKNTVSYQDTMLANGIFDLQTSAALTMFMGDPFAPDAQGAAFATMPFAFVSDPKTPPLSVMSGANMFFYIRLHGNDKSPLLGVLVKQFQHDVNTDLKYPPGHLTGKLTEDGKYGPATQKAASVYGLAVIPT